MAFFLTHNHECLHDWIKNISKEPLMCPNRSQFGTGLAWMLYKYLPVSFYCAIDRCNRSTSLRFRFQRSLRSHSFMVHSFPPSIAHISIVDPQYSQYRLPSSSGSTLSFRRVSFDTSFFDAPRISCIYGRYYLLTGHIILPSYVDIKDVYP